MRTDPSTLPYVVQRGAGSYYKRRVPSRLRETLGASTFTVRLHGDPGSRAFLASYSQVHQQAETRLRQAQATTRQLTPHEQLGVAGAWVKRAGWSSPDDTFPAESAAILQTLGELQIALPFPTPADWEAPETVAAHPVQALAGQISSLSHPAYVNPWLMEENGEVVLVRSEREAAQLLTTIVRDATPGLNHWIKQARTELSRLGVVVPQTEIQAIALRLCTTARALAHQVEAIDQGEIPPPLQFPEPPAPTHDPSNTFTAALERWSALRNPAAKTVGDAKARLAELAAHVGHEQLGKLNPDQVAAWRSSLLENLSAATVKRRIALVRAVLQTAAADGLPIASAVIERLDTKNLRDASGTKRQRRPFTLQEASTLWQISRTQTGPRPLDRWAFPLGLSIGARLEEIAGLRRQDIREIDGHWVAVIEPSEDRRLKNDTSSRTVPIPQALIAEGFVTWATKQSEGLLFPEPPPPDADPRLSHYASIRLGKIIRQQAGITDPTAVFHSCRHFTAQSLVDAGCEQRAIEQLLGHSSRSMTARYSRAGIPLPQLVTAMEGRDWGWIPRHHNQAA